MRSARRPIPPETAAPAAAPRARRGRAGALALALLLAGCRDLASTAEDTSGGAAPAALAAAQAGPGSLGGPGVVSYAGVVARISPSVVTVRSERRVRAPRTMPFGDDPQLREFFGDRGSPGQQPVPVRGLGSGVVVDPQGLLLTNSHVVDGAESVQVELADGRVLPAEIVGTDPPSDLAVLRLTGARLPAIPLGDSDAARVGDVVLAAGSPLGLPQTVTLGILSAKGRTTGLGDGSFEDFLQTDAAINQGNSGGALVNMRGELIGINSQILSPTGGNIGIGFAIPVNMARSVMRQLVESGRVRRGQLGVAVQDVTSDIAASLGLESVGGVIVSGVTPGSPAARAGVEVGDVIVALDGRPIDSGNVLRNTVAATPPGTAVTLSLRRAGRQREVRATLGELEVPAAAGGAAPGGAPDQAAGLGVQVAPLTADAARQLGLPPQTQGLVVGAVDPLGPAAAAGLQPGDVISRADGQPLTRPEELRQIVQAARDRPVLLLVNRGGQTSFVPVPPRR